MLLSPAFKLTNALALKFYFINNYTPNFCRSRFHQHFTWAFCAHILGQKITKLCFGFEIFWCKNIGKKSALKMLMKLTPIHLTWSYTQLLWFALYTTHQKDLHKSTGPKAVHRMVMYLTPGIDFTNILLEVFTSPDPKSAKKQVVSIFLRFEYLSVWKSST